jgi:predicted DNA-binding transcriptional regulator AlpA
VKTHYFAEPNDALNLRQDCLLKDHEVALKLCVSVATVRRWRLLGQGPRYRKLGGAVRYAPEDVKAWLDNQPTGGSREQEGKP